MWRCGMNILIITNKSDIPSNAVIEAIEAHGDEVFRLNTDDLCKDIDIEINVQGNHLNGVLNHGERSIDLTNIKSVFYRRPQIPQLDHIENDAARVFIEGEMSAFINWLCQTLPCFWISHPNVTRRAESKIDQLRIVPHFGFEIPKTLITNKPDRVREFYQKCSGQIINNVLAKGMIEVDGTTFGIYTHRVEKEHLEHLDLVKYVPCVFQERIEKDFELRITVVGKEIFAAEIHSQLSLKTRDDWRRYDIENTPHKIHNLPDGVKESCLRLLAHYALNFGAIDMIVTPEGRYVFLEINPNGQWLWIERLTGLPITEAIANMLIRASIQ